MGKVFESATTYDPNPGQYSWDNWNQAMVENPVCPRNRKILTCLVKGNFYMFMNVLLDFEYISELQGYGPKKERRFGAKRHR